MITHSTEGMGETNSIIGLDPNWLGLTLLSNLTDPRYVTEKRKKKKWRKESLVIFGEDDASKWRGRVFRRVKENMRPDVSPLAGWTC